MRSTLITFLFVFFSICCFGQNFKNRTCSETLKEQTMGFSREYSEGQKASLTLWGQSTKMGAVLFMLDLNKSPKPVEMEYQYEVVGSDSLYLTMGGKRFLLVKFYNDNAYVYTVDDEKLVLKLPRKI